MKDLIEKMDILGNTGGDLDIPEFTMPKGKDGAELTS